MGAYPYILPIRGRIWSSIRTLAGEKVWKEKIFASSSGNDDFFLESMFN